MSYAIDDYQVAVPSYLRPVTLAKCTLSFLADGGVHPGRIAVFVHDNDPHLDAYRQLCDSARVQLNVTSSRGINEQRRFMADYYPAGTPVVQMDDDVSCLVRATGPKTLETVTNIDRFIREAFNDLRAADLRVWGVGAVANAYFMHGRRPSYDLKFLIGTLWGYFSRPGHPVHQTCCPVKEDYEVSLRAWWYDGGVLRYNDMAVKADHYKTPGGCQESRTAAVSEQATRMLLGDWPGLVRRNERRTSGHAEVLLARKGRHAGNPVDVPPPGLTRPA